MKSTIDISRSRVKRILYLTLGFVGIILGIFGVLLPVLPGMLFFALSVYAFAKSSEKFHNYLINHKYLSKYILKYIDGEGITIKERIISIIFIWISTSISIYVFSDNIFTIISLILFTSFVTYHLITIGKKKNKFTEQQ